MFCIEFFRCRCCPTLRLNIRAYYDWLPWAELLTSILAKERHCGRVSRCDTAYFGDVLETVKVGVDCYESGCACCLDQLGCGRAANGLSRIETRVLSGVSKVRRDSGYRPCS